jgi:hypothetical protein
MPFMGCTNVAYRRFVQGSPRPVPGRKARGFGVTERDAGVGCLKNTQFLESDLNREREFADAALVHLRRSIENNKEAKSRVMNSA